MLRLRRELRQPEGVDIADFRAPPGQSGTELGVPTPGMRLNVVTVPKQIAIQESAARQVTALDAGEKLRAP